MYFIKTELRPFSAAHRIIKGYRGKCRHLHGHNYGLNLVISADQVNEYDFVIDFDDVKRLCDGWVQSHLDHATLIAEDDSALLEFVKQEDQKYYILPGGVNTTVECLAKHLFETFNALMKADAATLNSHACIHTVEVWESAKSGAFYSEKNLVCAGDPCGERG